MTTVTLHLLTGGDPLPVEMPSVTTVRYAAKRCAEALGVNPDAKEWLLSGVSKEAWENEDDSLIVPLRMEDIVAGFDEWHVVCHDKGLCLIHQCEGQHG